MSMCAGSEALCRRAQHSANSSSLGMWQSMPSSVVRRIVQTGLPTLLASVRDSNFGAVQADVMKQHQYSGSFACAKTWSVFCNSLKGGQVFATTAVETACPVQVAMPPAAVLASS